MADIRLKTITVESSPLIIQNGRVFISDTTPSTSAITGSLVLSGGLGIGSTADASSSTSGGALTVAGGIAIMKSLDVGGDLILEKASSEFRVDGITIPRLQLDSATAPNPKLSLAPDGISRRLELSHDRLLIDIPTQSINATTGALCISGGLSIGSTTNSTSISGGGALTVRGGASIGGTLFVGKGINSLGSNTLGNLFTTTDGNVGIGTTSPNMALSITPHTSGSKINLFTGSEVDASGKNTFTGLGVSVDGNLKYHLHSTTASHVFYTGPEKEVFRITGNGRIGIGTSSPQNALDVNGAINFTTTLNSYGNVLNNQFTSGTKYTINTNSIVRNLRTSRANAVACVSQWYRRQTVSSNAVGVSPSLEVFVAVGENHISISHDGIDWTTLSEPFTGNSIAWSEFLGYFIVTGNNREIVKINFPVNNTVEWTFHQPTGLFGVNMNNIIWVEEFSMFLVVGNNGTLAYSTDGLDWQLGITNINITGELNDIVWSADTSLFVAVGDDGIIGTSRDGMSWNIQTVFASDLNSVAWSSELSIFVAVGNGGLVAYSSNGVTWTTVTGGVGGGVGDLLTISWSEQLSIFVVGDTSGKIAYSNNGINWVVSWNGGAGGGSVKNVIWSPEFSMFVAVGTGGWGIATSELGIPARRSSLLVNPSHMFVNQSTGNVGIGTTSPQYRLHVIGNVFASGMTTANVNVTNDIVAHTIRANQFTGANLTLTGTLIANNMTTNMLSSGNVWVSGGIVSSTLKTTHLSTGSLHVSGDVSCGTLLGTTLSVTGPQHTIGILSIGNDAITINGGLNASGSLSVNLTETQNSDNSTTGAVVMFGGLSIGSSQESMSVSSGGALTVAGGVAVGKRLFVGGPVHFNYTGDSVESGTVADIGLRVAGDLSINGTQEATGATLASALKVAGGVSLGKDLYVGGTLHNNAAIRATDLVIYGTEPASNFSTGSLIINGGVTISKSDNATSVTSGGALLVSGGGSIGGDLYVGGKTHVYGGAKYYSDNPIVIAGANGASQFGFRTIGDNFVFARYSNTGALLENVYTVDGGDGSIVFNNTRANIAFSVLGNVLVESSEEPVFSENNGVPLVEGGALRVLGGMSVGKSFTMGGDLVILSTTESQIVDTGALRVAGGMGISKNLNVGGNLTVLENLYVRGSLTTIESQNSIFDDNLIIMNAAPAPQGNSGFIIKRYQESANDNRGDVVADSDPLVGTLDSSVEVGGNTAQFTGPMEDLTHWWIKVGNQVRKIISYDEASRTVTVDEPWIDGGTGYQLYRRSFVGMIYNEISDRFEFGSVLTTGGNESFAVDVPVAFYSGIVESRIDSVNGSTGSLVCEGGVSISHTTDATSATSGGGLTVSGGVGIEKSLYVGEKLYVGNVDISPHPSDVYQSGIFSADNDVSQPAPIGSFILHNSTWGFDAYLHALLIKQNPTNPEELDETACYYHLRGVNKGSGNWELVKTYVGNNLGIEFSIANDQGFMKLHYTTINYSQDFVTLEFKWRVFAV